MLLFSYALAENTLTVSITPVDVDPVILFIDKNKLAQEQVAAEVEKPNRNITQR